MRLYHLKKFILLPLTIVSSILIESGKKYFGNESALSDMLGMDDASSSRIETPATLLTIGSAVMQLSLISYFMYKTLTKPYTKSLQNEKSNDSTEIENQCKTCKKNYCSRSRHCVGTSFITYFKFIGLTTIIPVGILSAILGLETLVPKDSRETSWFKTMLWTMPAISSYQYLSYNLINGAFENIELIGKTIRNKQYNLACKPFALTALISLPCVLLSGPFIYFYSKKAMVNLNALSHINDQELNSIALVFGTTFIPIQAMTLAPTIYELIQDISKHGCTSILAIPSKNSAILKKITRGCLSNPFRLLALINISAIACDATSNLLGMRISAKCLASDFNIGTLANRYTFNSSNEVISCQTATWVEAVASISAGSAALLFLVFNLRQLKRLFYELNESNTPTDQTPLEVSTEFSLNTEPESKNDSTFSNGQKFSLFGQVNNQELTKPLLEDTTASPNFA